MKTENSVYEVVFWKLDSLSGFEVGNETANGV